MEGEGHTHALDESAKVFHLGPEKQVAQLGIGEKHKEEHDGKAQERQVLTTSPTDKSMRISRLLAMPRISSFLLPLNLVPKWKV